MTNIKNFKVFMHVDRYYYAAHMYKKCLILGLLILISGNVINFTFQFYDGQRIFAQTNQSPEADDQKVSVDANDKIKIILEGKDDDKDDEIKFDIVSDPSHGKLDNFDKSDGTVTYSPEEDYSGDDEFKFKVVDDKGAESNKGSVDIKVEATNKSPEADDQKVSVDANDKIKIILEGKDDDKDDEIKLDIVSDPSHGKL
ncbi:MAG: Ig-like domain-containing protein, partial [Nitrososphaeraceae archaeon]|nr:Ig-like domain-containing protein [Nitrososphaeraceae archaeon]